MKARIIAVGLVMSLAAGGAVASSWHWAKAPTREEAMRLATDKAQARAKRKGTCFKPAVRVNDCQATADGFRCRADSASDFRACGVRVDWVYEPPLPPTRTGMPRLDYDYEPPWYVQPPYMSGSYNSSSTWELDQFPPPTAVRLP
ncbi:hypothetical protein CFHF_07975 [Caulobacter flavus]|jgi:hypothetical protein|uniref:DUF1190 domain-containing protein n=1 Tax=Caulobacter flavus TaxID=1679497 RepID=A0A2N5CVC9_9CAUL|nr:hypothetical protein [Caulobacter flavus]AYV46847.1 hypothetical protein C1707_11560 [Caulobacter flavus]PLR17755.1 hypothetical protein CFHF_07975 [Caulobacter flavus]